jgi:hypothetical protein
MSPNRELDFISKAKQLLDAGYLENYVYERLLQWELSEAEAQNIISKAQGTRFSVSDEHTIENQNLYRSGDRTKRKNQPKNLLQYFMDEFILFRREFYYEIEAKPETVAEEIQNLEQTYVHPWKTRRIVSKTDKLGNGWQVTIIVCQKQKRYQNAKVEAVVYFDEFGQGIFKGELTTGGDFYTFYFLLITLFSVLPLCVALEPYPQINFAASLFSMSTLLIGIGYRLMLNVDGKHLLESVEWALFKAKNKKQHA